ncbi:alpha-L-fucosidase [Panacibacter sp. DH6]|uniref:alpha-L-fucosidase n=1 Tax=Panacibacter microcysteis TaxID=2793269 RepID=A0A931E5E7_9BACT|nr:alpha-L-fucosidase [Panacibacter microcysteis]MBG9375469.1 alpha-L-fucosidase [Panacibacter microcysteis]
MKKFFLFFYCLCISCFVFAQKNYTPAPENLQARQWFADARFGLFIHWGPFSIPGDGEWVMNNRNITVKNYSRLMDFFNPIQFDAAKWVGMAKDAGMKYITLITRHHDGFSMWNTKYSDFNIMNTPYKKDIVKLMADECHKQGIKLYLYYSLLDWRRDDYSWSTGRTGKGTGRTVQGNWNDYLSFMKNQLTELLTNYGEIGGIWFDGHWDQTAPEGAADRSAKIDWHYDEIYGLIHKLQPACLIGNNHHMTPFPGEDFQMFEKDLPGENKSGLSYQEASDKLPVETCETINNSWGFNITDTTYKSNEQLLHYLVKASGLGVNFLLNIGPMPNGEIQPEFKDRLHWMGDWLRTYGESIYNTNAGYLKPQAWGCLTQKTDKIYVHVFDNKRASVILEQFPFKKIKKAYLLKDKTAVKTQLKNDMAQLFLPDNIDEPDEVIVLEVKN